MCGWTVPIVDSNYNLYLPHEATASPHNELVIIILGHGCILVKNKVSRVLVEEEN